MREILFKAKRKDNGEWVEGFLFHCLNNGEEWWIGNEPLSANDYSEIIGEYRTWFPIDENTICQYTGLTDKNGNKIWENDIVEVKNDKHHFISQIEWDNWCKGFMFQDTKTTACGMDAISDSGCYRFGCEVIGNIFDNTELVGEQNG